MNNAPQKILVTGCAGFIGMHVTIRLLQNNHTVIGIDNLNNYYDINLKKSRLDNIKKNEHSSRFRFVKLDISNKHEIFNLFENENFDGVINLAAQAGVCYSIINPDSYIKSNIIGFFNILESCKKFCPEGHLVFASSSSVYGLNETLPFSEENSTDHSLSLYAASKKSNEVIAHSYANIHNLTITGLRFFTVYGPWGRPDMALFLFTKAILEKQPIKLFNYGDMIRDFTYIDDVTNAVCKIYNKPAAPDKEFNKKKPSLSSSVKKYKIFNVGNGAPIKLNAYVEAIENALGVEAIKEYLPIQEGDVMSTASNTDSLHAWIKFRPSTSIIDGVESFIKWYQNYYNT